MKPDELVKFVFAQEGVDYNLRDLKLRNQEIVQARYKSMYLLHHFFPELRQREIAGIFKKDHGTVIHAYKTITNEIATNDNYSHIISNYIHQIRDMIKKGKGYKVNCKSVIFKMPNKRAILIEKPLGYVIVLKRLNGKKVESTSLNISRIAMKGIINAYQYLNK